MYRHCLFCNRDLGSNDVIEAFSVGRRLAFDPGKGRLWVLCRHCERWNLTPLEERWEALEEAEKIFRETPLRVSTEEIGLARLREGLELVRVGRPERGEFASWRYGDRFGRRRRRFILRSTVGIGVVGGVVVGSVGVIGGAAALSFAANSINVVNGLRHVVRPSLRLARTDAEPLEVRLHDVRGIRLRPGGTADRPDAEGHLTVKHRSGVDPLTGRDAVRALRTLLPSINHSGASRKDIGMAVQELEETGGPEGYFAAVEMRARRQGMGYMPLLGLPRPLRLALEMAAHEDVERVALEGELAWLEEAWREAERLATISDDLTLPDRVRIRFAELKARHGRVRSSRESEGQAIRSPGVPRSP